MVHEDFSLSYYNNDPTQLIRQDIHDKWEPHFNIAKPVGKLTTTFKQEVLHSCELMYDAFKQYTPKINLFYSGGMDSECMLRCFHQLKIPINPIILVHHHHSDAKETVDALKLCKSLSITPTIFNINLPALYASGKLHELGLRYQTARMGMLELIYVLEHIQSPSILADDIQLVYTCSQANLINRNETDYLQWFYEIREDEDGLYNRYEHLSGIPTIADSFRYTPQSWSAMILTNHIKDIVLNDKGKASSYSTKNAMMSKEFSVPYRDKTNVFVSGHHRGIANRLRDELTPLLLPPTVIRIEYTELLRIFGVDYAV